MANALGVKSPETVRKFLQSHSIPYTRRPGTRQGHVLGAKHRAWKGGRQKSNDGYIWVQRRDHPHANHRGYVREHRLVAEQMLGRYLEPGEVVHHKNAVRDDNRPENLEVFPNNGLHCRAELTGRIRTEASRLRMRETWARRKAEGYRVSETHRENLRKAWARRKAIRQSETPLTSPSTHTTRAESGIGGTQQR